MHLENVAQPPLETSLMGVMRGVLDHFEIEASTPWLYGASGHAFVVNIHPELCPSGPYCWDSSGFTRLLENLGVVREDLGFFPGESAPEDRARVEAAVREHLDRGMPCSMANMDHQLITGYDETGFLAAQPWGDMPITPGHLTFGSWEEFGRDVHANFFRFHPTSPVDARAVAREGLAYALDLFARPERHTQAPYGVGPNAYRNWMAAVTDGHGGSHGAWWNATVWSECRKMAAAFLQEIAERFPLAAGPALELAERYAVIGGDLERASDKAMGADEKIALLEETAVLEEEAVAAIPAVLTAIGPPEDD